MLVLGVYGGFIDMTLDAIDHAAQIIWDYHHLNQVLQKADVILVLGSHDIRIAEYAADLFLRGYAPYIIFSGGIGRLTEGVFEKPEADTFAEIALKHGVSREKIIIENRSTNTGENIKFTRTILAEQGLNFNSFLLVQKPYMERRAFATFKKVWPEKECVVTSPPISFLDYPTETITRDEVIHIMVGDLQRIRLYGENGFQIPQEIPAEVWQAFEELVWCGYTSHLLHS